jgi:peptide/nickel transport system substrate-binding protein
MRTGALVAGSAAVALVLSACGSGGDTAKPNSSETAKGVSGFNAATKGVVNPSDKKGGTLKLVNNSDPDSFDPARAYYAYVWNFMKGYYVRTLLTNEAKPGDDGLKLVPDLAAPVREINKKLVAFRSYGSIALCIWVVSRKDPRAKIILVWKLI